MRLTELSYNAGLADKFRYDYTCRKYDTVSKLNQFFEDVSLRPEHVNEYLGQVQTSEINARTRIAALISRPQVELGELFNYVPRGTFSKNNIDLDAEFASPLSSVLSDGVEYSDLIQYGDKSDFSKKASSDYPEDISYADAAYVLQFNTEYPVSRLDAAELNAKVSEMYKKEILDSSEISIKYKGYIQREQQMADKIMRLENLAIPENFDFDKVESLSIECRQKLKKYAPRTIAQASRISGISPADISVLLVYFGR